MFIYIWFLKKRWSYWATKFTRSYNCKCREMAREKMHKISDKVKELES